METTPTNSVCMQIQVGDGLEWVLFSRPVEIVSSSITSEVEFCLSEVERYVQLGYFAVGYVSYEAAQGISNCFFVGDKKDYPLIWFGIYHFYEPIDMLDNLLKLKEGRNTLKNWEASISRNKYLNDVDDIFDKISKGDTYQVNHTFRLYHYFDDNPFELFCDMVYAQQSEYCAYINMGRWHMCSASPELFFSYNQGEVFSKPMKGTVRRPECNKEAEIARDWLYMSEKNRAENIMIVDMMRNDLAQVAEVGSVRVDELFSIEEYPTVYQMTSKVSAVTKQSAVQVFSRLFPCASITGAPKIKTMEIIRDLEVGGRGVYTGSIGYFSPDNNARFNVAIRTAVIDQEKKELEYGVGSGVIWEAKPEAEYDECIAKAQVVNVGVN